MIKKVSCAGLLIFIFIIVSACSNNGSSGSPTNKASESQADISTTSATQQPVTEPMTQKNSKAINWEVTSKVHYTQGTITEVHQSGEYADALTINVETGYPSDNDPLEKPFFEPGETIRFELLTTVHVSQFKLEKGKKVILKNSQFTPKDSETPFWGGDIIGYDRDGTYVDLTGKPANFSMSDQASLKDGKLIIK